jgi:Zinc knuckle
MIQEESRIKLHSDPSIPFGVRSALATASSGMIGAQGEIHGCYNCGEIGHLRQVCPKPPKEKDSSGRGQSRGRGRGCGGRSGRQGGYRTNLMVEEEDSMPSVVFSEEDRVYLEVLQRKQKKAEAGDGVSTSSLFKGNVAYSVATTQSTCDSLALASFPTAGSSEWIIDSRASGHVKGTDREFSSYTRRPVPLSVKTTDGTDQPVVGKGTVKCTNTLTSSKVLYALFFINLV